MLSDGYMYFLVKHSRKFGPTPDREWFASDSSDACTDARFSDSITLLREVRIRDGIRQTMNMVRLQEDAKAKYYLGRASTVEIVTIPREEYLYLKNQQESEVAAWAQ